MAGTWHDPGAAPSAQLAVIANGLEFAILAQRPADRPLALSLHGFPTDVIREARKAIARWHIP
jgi:hypothetical protein